MENHSDMQSRIAALAESCTAIFAHSCFPQPTNLLYLRSVGVHEKTLAALQEAGNFGFSGPNHTFGQDLQHHYLKLKHVLIPFPTVIQGEELAMAVQQSPPVATIWALRVSSHVEGARCISDSLSHELRTRRE